MTSRAKKVRALAASLLLLGATRATAARAQSSPEADPHRAEARAIAEQGDAAFASGRCDLAIPLWRKADAAFHAPTLILRVARCQSLLGHVVDAAATFRAVVNEPLAADAPEAFVAARESARNEVAAASERVASLRVRVVGAGTAAPAVEVDGLASAAGEAVSLDPGEHQVHVRVLGASYEQAVSLADGQKRELTVSVSLQQRPPVVPTRRKAGYAIGAAGVTLTIAGGVFGALALGSASTLSGACGGDRQHCPAGDQGTISTLKTRALAADLTLGSGIALLAGGAVIALTAGPARSEAPVVHLSASAGGLVLGGAF